MTTVDAFFRYAHLFVHNSWLMRIFAWEDFSEVLDKNVIEMFKKRFLVNINSKPYDKRICENSKCRSHWIRFEYSWRHRFGALIFITTRFTIIHTIK